MERKGKAQREGGRERGREREREGERRREKESMAVHRQMDVLKAHARLLRCLDEQACEKVAIDALKRLAVVLQASVYKWEGKRKNKGKGKGKGGNLVLIRTAREETGAGAGLRG